MIIRKQRYQFVRFGEIHVGLCVGGSRVRRKKICALRAQIRNIKLRVAKLKIVYV